MTEAAGAVVEVAVTTEVALGNGEGGTSVAVGRFAGEAGSVDVGIGEAVGVIGVRLATGVIVGIGEGVAVLKRGLPNSRHPKSGAVPINPLMGVAGINSPFVAIY